MCCFLLVSHLASLENSEVDPANAKVENKRNGEDDVVDAVETTSDDLCDDDGRPEARF